MPKRLLQDMVAVKSGKRVVPEVKKISSLPRISSERNIEKNHLQNRSRYFLWVVAFISAVFCFFAISFLFSQAEIIVDPKTQDVVLDENLSASKDSNSEGLSFDLMVISGEESKNIPANGEKNVAEKAIGTAVIYNNFSSSPQALNIDTRLEGSNGKIYKTQTKTTVPGKSANGTPGSVEVKIYGAEAGQEYNSAPLDFKILGFKGTPKYSKFYGRSKGEIVGGFKGTMPAVSDIEKTLAVLDLKKTLQAKLFKKATGQIPGGFVLFKDAIFLNTSATDISIVAKDDSATITLKGTLYGLLLNEQKLIKKIAQERIEKYDESEVYISNIQNLTFALANKENISFGEVKNIDFNLSGSAKIVWKIDENKFIADLLGKSKKDFSQILSQYANINSATLNISPIWRTSIPDKAKDIKLIINYPQNGN